MERDEGPFDQDLAGVGDGFEGFPVGDAEAVQEADVGDVTALLDAAVRRALLSEAEADRLTDAIASGARSEEEVAAEWEWAARLALPTGGAAVDPRPSSE